MHRHIYESKNHAPSGVEIQKLVLSLEVLNIENGVVCGREKDVKFLFDSGAYITYISRQLADSLALPRDCPRTIGYGVGKNRIIGYRSRLRLRFAGRTVAIPCVFPAIALDEENLIGMRGLLESHLFVFSAREFHMFRVIADD